MKPIEEIRQELKDLIPKGIDVALKTLKQFILTTSSKYNRIIALEGRYRKNHRNYHNGEIKISDNNLESNKIREAIFAVIDELEKDDLNDLSVQANKKTFRSGKILYRIPHIMQVNDQNICLVRIAFNEETLTYDISLKKGDEIAELRRVSDVMSVELIDPAENSPFEILAFSETIQFIDEDDYTEWKFFVTPIFEGEFTLLLKVSVIEIRSGKERKRDIVLEEQIQIIADQPLQEENVNDFTEADETIFMATANTLSRTEKTAIIEIMDTDQDEFASLIKESDIEFKPEGESSGLDGMSLLAFSLSITPNVLSIIEALFAKWLKKRKTIQIKVNGVVIEADSLDELERIMTALGFEKK